MSLTAKDLNDLCSSSFTEGLEGAPVAELRAKRDACQRAEMVLSYLRRVIQGEIDLLLAEIDQRRAGGSSDISRLVDELPQILSSPAPAGPAPAHPPLPIMGDVAELGDEIALDELLAELVAESTTVETSPGGLLPGANLCAFGDDELSTTLGALKEVEASISAKRRRLHEHIDSLQGAIVDRYKSGAADPDSLLA